GGCSRRDSVRWSRGGSFRSLCDRRFCISGPFLFPWDSVSFGCCWGFLSPNFGEKCFEGSASPPQARKKSNIPAIDRSLGIILGLNFIVWSLMSEIKNEMGLSQI